MPTLHRFFIQCDIWGFHNQKNSVLTRRCYQELRTCKVGLLKSWGSGCEFLFLFLQCLQTIYSVGILEKVEATRLCTSLESLICSHLQLQLSDVINEMDDDWGSLACPSSDSHTFWKHEWTKHGTCSGLGQHGYFKSAVDLYGKYDITAALAKHGNWSSKHSPTAAYERRWSPVEVHFNLVTDVKFMSFCRHSAGRQTLSNRGHPQSNQQCSWWPSSRGWLQQGWEGQQTAVPSLHLCWQGWIHSHWVPHLSSQWMQRICRVSSLWRITESSPIYFKLCGRHCNEKRSVKSPFDAVVCLRRLYRWSVVKYPLNVAALKSG